MVANSPWAVLAFAAILCLLLALVCRWLYTLHSAKESLFGNPVAPPPERRAYLRRLASLRILLLDAVAGLAFIAVLTAAIWWAVYQQLAE